MVACIRRGIICGDPFTQTPRSPKGGPMKFSDFFIPKIARSDPKVREQAVLECQDKDLLKRVIQHDKDEHVRQVAKQRLDALSA
jgi:hypothetical protein